MGVLLPRLPFLRQLESKLRVKVGSLRRVGELDPGGDEGDREGESRPFFQGGQPLPTERAGRSWAHSQDWGGI